MRKSDLFQALSAIGVCDALAVAKAVERTETLRLAVITTHAGFKEWCLKYGEARARQHEDMTENAFRVSDERQLRGVHISGFELYPPLPDRAWELRRIAETRIR